MRNRKGNQSFPVPALTVSSVIVVASIFTVSSTDGVTFAPYFGIVPPVTAAIFVCLAGIAALYVLEKIHDLPVFARQLSGRQFLIAVAAAVPFMVLVTVVDLTIGFPVDINVPLPAAIIFYPAMGYIAQLALHIVPLSVLLSIGKSFFSRLSARRRLWVSIVLASMPESVFQVSASLSDGKLTLLGSFVAMHLFAFGLVELYLFRRFDYATMFVFRMAYYAYWHLAWGTLRLQWVF
jgi:hypothetical protein